MKWLCKIGLHKWVYSTLFDMQRDCKCCGKRQYFHQDRDFIGRWV